MNVIIILSLLVVATVGDFNYRTTIGNSYRPPPPPSYRSEFTLGSSGSYHQGKPYGQLDVGITTHVTPKTSITVQGIRDGDLTNTKPTTGVNGIMVGVKVDL